MAEDADVGVEVRDRIAELDLPIAVIELDRLRVVSMSRTAERGLGVPADQVIGRPVIDLLQPEDRPKAVAALRALAGGVVDFYRAHRPVGSSPDGPAWAVVWVRAVTFGHERQALAQLGVSAGEPSPLAAHLGREPGAMAIGSMDATSMVTAVSADLFELLGVPAEDLVGRRLLGLVAQRDVTRVLEANRRAHEERAVALRVRLRDASGGWRNLCCILTSRARSEERCFLLVPDPAEATDGLAGRADAVERQLAALAVEVSGSNLLQRVRAVPDPGRFPELGHLTRRQWEVLSRLVAGERVPTIAEHLFVSRSTVRNHLSAIFVQFGVHTQAELLEVLRERPSD